MSETSHTIFMTAAIEVARSNPVAPFGCVLVCTETEQVVAKGVNQSHLNPILHGELVAINNYADANLKSWHRLRLYTTAEPCPMCQAAILWAGIPEVIFGSSIDALARMGWKQIRIGSQHITSCTEFGECQMTGGILASQCDELFAESKRTAIY